MTDSSLCCRLLLGVVVATALSVAPLLSERGSAHAQGAEQRTHDFDQPSQPLADALRAVGSKAAVNIVFDPVAVRGKQAPALRGSFTAEDAVKRLIDGAGLTVRKTDGGSLLISAAAGREAVAMPQIMVQGARVLNMDLPRSREDVQPYVIFDRTAIERSGARNIDDFLKQRLTMNTIGVSNEQQISTLGNNSSINLRGLGSNQTLILVDGHRSVDYNSSAGPQQASISGIPLFAVERIEVLPTTASGIYGGSAVGGVLNVILRRDYQGADVRASYGNTFVTNTGVSGADVGLGFDLENGRSVVLLAASHVDNGQLLVGDRDFIQLGRTTIFANNPGFFLNAASPPLGFTTNIRSANGSNLILKNNNTPLNSPRTFIPVGYSGTSTDRGAALVANAGRYNLDLAQSAQFSEGALRSLVRAANADSGIATLRREFSPRLNIFLEAFASNVVGVSRFGDPNAVTIPATASNNPFTTSIIARYPTSAFDTDYTIRDSDRRVVGGVIFAVTRDWKAEADYSWSLHRNHRATNPPTILPSATTALQNGQIDVLRDTNLYPVSPAGLPSTVTPYKTTLGDAVVRASGPVFALPGGDAMLSGILEHRKWIAEESGAFNPVSNTATFQPERSQTIRSAYAELKVPIFSPRNAVFGANELDVQLAVRRDDYSTHGVTNSVSDPAATITRATNEVSSTDPTVGVRFRPVQDLTLRASYGTGFLAPGVNQIVPTAPFGPTPTQALDPRRGNEPVVALTTGIGSGNPGLRPEQSKSWSGGLILTPRFTPDWRLSVDYTRIRKTDNITTLSFQQLIDNETTLGRITRGPVPAGDPFGVGPITLIDNGSINVARSEVDAYDMQLDYRGREGAAFGGSLELFALATWQTHYRTQLIASAPLLEKAGVTSSNPLKFKSTAGFTWTRGRLVLGWSVSYFDSYNVADPAASTYATTVANQGGQRVPSQAYHNAFVTYRLARSPGENRVVNALGNAELQLSARNVFNKKPPFDAGNTTDYYSYFGDPRMASYNLSVRVAF